MSWLRSGAVSALVGCLVLAACSSWSVDPPPPTYAVRSASVVADQALPPVSPALVTAVNDRVNAAIAATTYSQPLPQVAITVRLTDVRRARGFNRDRNSVKVNIDAAALDGGAVVAMASFETKTTAPDPATADELMAEDIAARVRSIFSLTTPRLAD
ncbi:MULTISPECIES: hypothetical protein [Rhizobium]|uniref:Lipoprotein n=1 Tax=Rhizobium tropici TaxID=398 RepID=A0A329Y9P4_RHITR|nr:MULTISPECIES: hypothetical protein [Rhizobium]MBB3286240.1 hypothetical protein [Rhizobium sp. BK252]MBB3400598.1 hypothetical protein [Rhizobium sp. BK289]MBB3413558.1 hypothetical protein [Rhizobium sp. BK284]MBB3481064.1 hypothetical protein [Rhizobium sp. BK347]MDK4720439.1 hypothetical protein [Rhizobium sp. CNPSo 3968]